jgi:hypothetical protein
MAKIEESEALRALRQQLEALEGSKIAYASPHAGAIEAALQKIMEREEFSYDPAGDALYNRYKNYYENAGRRAMEDTMGVSAALTGGYGSTYAQTAAQQAYAAQMGALQEKIPELYALALESYRAEGDALQNRYDLLKAQEQADYSRYRDQVSDHDKALSRAQSRYESQRDYDFKTAPDQRDFDYKVNRDKVTDSQWERKFNESIRQFDERKRR